MPQTKIVCTIGPASEDEATLRALMSAGMNVARLNFSHGSHEEHAVTITRLRAVADSMQYPLAILQDLSGPKIRIGDIPSGSLILHENDIVTLTSRPNPVAPFEVSLPFPRLIDAVEPGNRVLLDDGCIQLEVEKKSSTDLECRTVVAGILKPHKGVNIPGVSFSIDSLTARDLDDLSFGLGQGVDWVAMSFVRTADDIRRLRKAIAARGADTPIIAKIEKHEAVHHLTEIIAAVDGVMVARGDLGVELPLQEVPLVQKRIIHACNAAGKPVITATQMLESMISNPRPTRAEVTDVCNAILDGTDAVMLSAETATGAYPIESVRVMTQVAERTEECLQHREILLARSGETGKGITDAISEGACDIAARLNAAAIICATSSGATARLVSRFRPQAPIVAATIQTSTWNRLALSWGVRPVLVRKAATFDRMVDDAIEAAQRTGLVRDGDVVLVTAGSSIGATGATNLIKVQVVGRPDHIG
ncbi:MAG TPA: pyruvate kinase [Armatimonadota bacterium]|nr:pyruvate kinase [Armatimonadota bacterium]